MLKRTIEKIFPGVWKLTFGEPDTNTPHRYFGGKEAAGLSERSDEACPLVWEDIRAEQRSNGFMVTLPLREDESLYGLGLQFHSFRQNGTRKTLRANADPVKDTGDSHAPVPFYASTAGYGVLADTAKCVTFDFGATRKVTRTETAQDAATLKSDTESLYKTSLRSFETTVFVPQAQGLTLFLFAGPTLLGAVERYNLFCGGGCMPTMQGLGVTYRCWTKADQKSIEEIVEGIRRDNMPVACIGLEPGWQSHSYSCSFKWSPERFPQPERLIRLLQEDGMTLNLWEQAYVHPTADFYQELLPHAGDYEVWEGLAPDFADPAACEIYGRQQGNLIDQGVDSVKLDECDGSDYTGGWYFPAFSKFPSGLTGEEEKNLYGALVQRAIGNEFEKRNLRTYSQVRANWSYGAPMGFVLYSDLYDHKEFIRALTTSTFSGLLWSPEVRQCESEEEILRRVQVAAFAPMTVINGWMIPIPPWKQYDIEKNRVGECLPDAHLQDAIRELMVLRNRFVPYLYNAFAAYAKNGTPPCRALVLDYPDDPETAEIDDMYMLGNDVLVAPIAAGETGRDVYLPAGSWYDFWTEEKLSGGQTIHTETEKIPLYVKENAVLPLADGQMIRPDTVIPLELCAYGTDCGTAVVVEDDRVSTAYRRGEQKICVLQVENGVFSGPGAEGYRVDGVRVIGL